MVNAIQADPSASAILRRIRGVVDGLPAGSGVAACGPSEVVETTSPAAFDAADLEGTYRFELSADDMRAGGVPEEWIQRNEFTESIMTIILDDGTVSVSDYLGDVQGTYTVSGDEVTFRIDDWASHWVMTPQFDPDGITWTFVDSLPPWGSDEDGVIDSAFWTTHPWIRIAEAG